MPDRRVSRRIGAVVGLTGLGLVLLGGVALAADEPIAPAWTGSAFTQPIEMPQSEATFDVGGEFKHSSIDVNSVAVTFGHRVDGDFVDVDEPDCLPADRDGTGTRPGDETAAGDRTFVFTIADTEWRCNGRYTVRATGSTGFGSQRIYADLVLAVPPAPVPSMDATVAGDDEAPDPETGATADDPATVEVVWEPIEETYPDFVGYRVQRAGPTEGSTFETVSEGVLVPEAREFSDTIEAPGTYRYRVQSLRTGPDGPEGARVSSTEAETPTVDVEVAGPPSTTSTTATTRPGSRSTPTTRTRLSLPQVGRGTNDPSPKSRLTVPTTPTTVDTGFDDNLDYGEPDDLDEPGEELAGEGQSVIQTEDEGAGLVGPVAGAMVLLGWAGHVAYLNRLSKQF